APLKTMQSHFGAQGPGAAAPLPAAGSKGLSMGGATTAPLPVGQAPSAPAPTPASALASRRFGSSGGQLSGTVSGAGRLSGAVKPAGVSPGLSSSPFQITGILAGRKIISKQLPVYPSWAQ